MAMTVSLHCPRCKRELIADDAEQLADDVLAHLESAHGHAPPREHVLARIERHNPPADEH